MLSGIRVLDLTRLLPGPFTSLLLADLGAEVIRVENPKQPDFLRWDPPLFNLLNRNKKSVQIRYDEPEGAEQVLRLAASADVFLESSRPGVMARFGLDSERLLAANPRLIVLPLSGYGQSGPLASRAGHDLNFLALSGLASGLSAPLRSQIADLSGGLMGALAVLAALFDRERRGQGRVLDVCLADGAWTLASGLMARFNLLSGASPMYRLYPCQDGRMLAVGSIEVKFQKALFEVLGLEHPGGDLFPNTGPEWHARLEAVIGGQPLSHWAARFAEVDACVEPVLTPEEARESAWFRERNLWQKGHFHPSFGACGNEPAPQLGQHNAEFLG